MTLLRTLDANFTIDAQLMIAASPIVLVNLFTVDPADEERFRSAWRAEAAFTKAQPGFISAQLHRAVGPSPTYFNYAVWESNEHLAAAIDNPNFHAKIFDYPPSTVAIPHLFQTVAVPGICIA